LIGGKLWMQKSLQERGRIVYLGEAGLVRKLNKLLPIFFSWFDVLEVNQAVIDSVIEAVFRNDARENTGKDFGRAIGI
jgi:hypothetical protein